MTPLFRIKFFLETIVLSGMICLSAGTPVKAEKSSKVDSVLVSVNGEPITLLDVILETGEAERELSVMFSGERLRTETQNLRKEVIEREILKKLVWEEYLKKPFDVPKQEIENYLDGISKNIGAFSRKELEQKAIEYGTNLSELRKKAKERIVLEVVLVNLCDRQVFVTPKEIYEEYGKHTDKWTIPGKAGLQLIQILHKTNGTDEKQLLQEISEKVKGSDRESFAELAKKYSNGLNAENGGFLDPIEFPRIRPEFAAVLKNQKIGFVAGPVNTPEAWYFLRLDSLESQKRIPLSKASEQIDRQIRAVRTAQARKEYSDKLRKKAVIRYHY